MAQEKIFRLALLQKEISNESSFDFEICRCDLPKMESRCVSGYVMYVSDCTGDRTGYKCDIYWRL
jgi:hypothetical protein